MANGQTVLTAPSRPVCVLGSASRVVEAVFRFSEVQQLRPILLPLMAEQPAAIIFYFDNNQPLGRGNYQIYLGKLPILLLHIQVMKDGFGMHSILQHLNDQLALGRSASIGGRHGREQLHISPLIQIRSYKTENYQGCRYNKCHTVQEIVLSYTSAFYRALKIGSFFQNETMRVRKWRMS